MTGAPSLNIGTRVGKEQTQVVPELGRRGTCPGHQGSRNSFREEDCVFPPSTEPRDTVHAHPSSPLWARLEDAGHDVMAWRPFRTHNLSFPRLLRPKAAVPATLLPPPPQDAVFLLDGEEFKVSSAYHELFSQVDTYTSSALFYSRVP